MHTTKPLVSQNGPAALNDAEWSQSAAIDFEVLVIVGSVLYYPFHFHVPTDTTFHLLWKPCFISHIRRPSFTTAVTTAPQELSKLRKKTNVQRQSYNTKVGIDDGVTLQEEVTTTSPMSLE